MKKWLKLLIEAWNKFNKTKRLKDFLLTVVTLALVAWGFWMLRLMEQMIKIIGSR